MMDCIVVGAGLTGSVIARGLAEQGRQVLLLDRRDHVGGNLFDYVEEHGFLVQKYGPHAFHTNDPALYEFLCRFEEWVPYSLRCGAVLKEKYTPTPFNFTTIDRFYPTESAERLKEKLRCAFPGRETVAVTEILAHPDPEIREYGQFLWENDYLPYTAKQWGISPEEIDPSILRRVPIRLSYRDAYFDDRWQVLPKHSYSFFFQNLLSHPGIHIRLNTDATRELSFSDGRLCWAGEEVCGPIVYTGALDELFHRIYGDLPYRSLRFRREYSEKERLQDAPVVAYPKAEGYTRITEYKQIPPQECPGTVYALEYPQAYRSAGGAEPYYPVLTENSREQYAKYRKLAESIPNLTVCGRLGDFQYYNMDQALKRALEIREELRQRFEIE